ncbi:MAG: tRNA pseudouridine(38-40) synthase TruA [Clostridia bacterium]
MTRIKLTIEYDGTNYAGWQRQINACAVQQVLEEALSRLTQAPTLLTGASRTDAGVHALGQVAHFDTLSRIPPEKYAYALNTLLPSDVRVVASQAVSPDFHARFDTIGKRYRYRIYAQPHASALYRNQCAHVIYPLDLALMREEARQMLGTHDFGAFAASGSVIKDTTRTITACDVLISPPFVCLTVEGSGFLYNMVRILAGTLIAVGAGKLEPGAIARALAQKDRLRLGPTAPPQGLTLMQVFY